MIELNGKNCLVTGGSRGIGKSIVKTLAEFGARVGFTYARSSGPAEELVKEIEAGGGEAITWQADAADFEKADEVISALVEKWGSLDVLVNNAGITRDNLILRMTDDDWDTVIETNLKSVFNYSKAAARPMMRNRNGSIINISSVVGLGGNAGQSNYAASKAGMIGFTKSYAKELASRNIRANVVAPGYIRTEMTGQLDQKVLDQISAEIPMGEPGETEDVARLVAYLSSDASSYITGEVIRIDGGMAM